MPRSRGAETIGADAVEAVAADMGADAARARAARREERVLPLRRPRRPRAVAADEPQPRTAACPIPTLERAIAALEARLEEQEAALRRVLTLLVDWVENGSQDAGAIAPTPPEIGGHRC